MPHCAPANPSLRQNDSPEQQAALEGNPGIEAGEIAANLALAAKIKAEVAAIRSKIAHITSGGTFWSRLAQDAEMELNSLGEEVLHLLGSLHYRPLGTYLSRDFPYPA
jgi:hypothetical protein